MVVGAIGSALHNILFDISFEAHIIRQKWSERYPKMRTDALLATMQLYGDIKFNRQSFLDGYARYHEQVKSYFAGRPNDFLIMNICQGNAWEILCNFLDKPCPDVPFPIKNAKKNITPAKQILSNIIGKTGFKTS
ncbi:MAG: sulfotransferase [Xenococcaceae cyanobacterium MO_234.B1]|nr:sulfotransferase [Xenococcaceae cyanobacterium MO_234.B1]